MTVTTAERAPKAQPKPAEPMKLTVSRAELLRALGHASAIVERRNTIPVLSNVLLEAGPDWLRIVATDLNLQVALFVPATVEGEGATTVSASLLHGIIRELPEGAQVELKLTEKRLQVISGRSRYNLQTVPETDFPAIKAGEATTAFSLPAKDLLRAIGRIIFCQSAEMIVRPYLCGINLEIADGRLVFAATDGNRLAWSSLVAPEGAELAGAILSTKLVATLVKLLDGRDDDVKLAFDDRKVTIELGDTILIGKLVEGTYPPWRRVIPAAGGKRLLITTEAFEAAVRRSSIIASERTRAVKVELTTDKMTVTATSLEHGVAVEETPCVWDSGDFMIGYNSRHLLDMLSHSGADEIEVEFNDAATPAIFTNPHDDSAKWILMPMRV